MKDTDKGFKNINKLLKELNKVKLKVGVLSDAGVNSKTREYIADYAYYNEYGSVDIPVRSFMASTADEQKENWSNSMSKAYDEIIKDEGKGLDYHLSRIGEQVRADIVLKISSNIAPKNAQSTIDKKKSDRTLVDTGILKQSIKYEIIK